MNYAVIALVVFLLAGFMAMAGLGAAFLIIPIFYYMGVPLPTAISMGLLLNVVALAFATPGHHRAGNINYRVGLPIVAFAVLLAPVGAHVGTRINHELLIGGFAAFLVVAGAMMLFRRQPKARLQSSRAVEIATGSTVGGGVGFLAGLLGVGGGSFVLPVLHGVGVEPREAAGTTALVALTSSLSGFAARATLTALDPVFVIVAGTAAAAGAVVGIRVVSVHLSNTALKRMIGIVLWLVAAKMLIDII
ncbi:MAG: TSUP family transporter [Gammaproteobacteria bacterium]|nr:TSUP family transporter [Gammaproteobacteria bacterium]